jgi:HlyD family secretion protein
MMPPLSQRHALALVLLLAACQRGAARAGSYPGTIEVDESDAAPLVGGRIVTVRVEEGDSVSIGDTLAVLTQSAIPATLEDRRARLAAARARLADLRRGSRSAELERARADLAATEAEADRTTREFARSEALLKGQVIAQQDFDRARTLAESAARRRDAAQATLELLEEGTRSDQVRAAEAEVRSAEAQLAGASADVSELAVVAAVSGVILGRHADPGEVVAAGTPLVTVGVVARPWVRVYLPASLIVHLPRGSTARVTPAGGRDADGMAGTLGSVSAKAEFTPRAALTEEERADLLFASRVELVNPPATVRPGLPVIVRFDSVTVR